MPTVAELIKLKIDRLEEVPDELLSRIQKVQKKVFPQVLDLISLIDRDKDGMIELTDNNLKLLANIQGQLRDVLLTSEYTEIVDEFIEEFKVQQGVSDAMFKKAFSQFAEDPKAAELVTLSQKRAAKIFIDEVTDVKFAGAIYDSLELAISNNASYAETVRQLQAIVIGDEETEGKIYQYARQIAHDQFALADRSYTSAVSEELDAEWFFYAGSVISGSREFCVERHNQYYYYKEIEQWASLDWDGKMDDTNEQTIFSTAGGWNCRHSIIPVSIMAVPMEVVRRNIDNGNFVPSDFEREELGLVA